MPHRDNHEVLFNDFFLHHGREISPIFIKDKQFLFESSRNFCRQKVLAK